MSESKLKERRESEKEHPSAIENQIRIAANGYFLDFTGELHSELLPEEFSDPKYGEPIKPGFVVRPVKIRYQQITS